MLQSAVLLDESVGFISADWSIINKTFAETQIERISRTQIAFRNVGNGDGVQKENKTKGAI